MKTEIKTEVKTFRVDKKCSKCASGLMMGTGKGIAQWDSSWEHKCDKCENVEWFTNESYPKTVYEDVITKKS